MTYARARLWLGIFGVGCIVVMSLIALQLDLPHRFLARTTFFLGITISLALYILISFPFDLFGGYLLPHWHKRTLVTFPAFMGAWLRGVLAQASLMALCGFAILEAGRRGGNVPAIVCTGILMLVLLLGQAPIARMVGGLIAVEGDFSLPWAELKQWGIRPPNTLAYSSADPSFVGGLV